MLKVGDQAPDITVHTDTGEDFPLVRSEGQARGAVFLSQGRYAGLHGGSLRVPRRHRRRSRKKGAAVVGISPDKPAAQAKFKQKYDLPFTLLADEEKAAAEAYGVWKEKNMYGRKVMGIERTTFVIGPDGKIEKIYGKVKAKGHAAAVLAEL